MPKKKRFDAEPSPLAVLYKILCNAVFDDIAGTNQTAYNALMILGNLVDKEAAADVKKKISEKNGRYRYHLDCYLDDYTA
jgi:hypothetical protein